MPLSPRPIAAGDPIVPTDLLVRPEVEPDGEPSTVEEIRAAGRLTPTLSLPSLFESYPEDPEFTPDWKTLPEDMRPFVDELEDAESEAEFHGKQSQIREEIGAINTLRAGGGSGIAWGMAAQMLDPVTLPLWFLPGSKFFQSAKTPAQLAGRVAAAGTIEATVSEGLLYASQETRTATDSVLGIGSTAVLGGLLGYGVGRWRFGAGQVEKLGKAIDDDLADINIYRRARGEKPSVGAASTATTLADEQPLRSAGATKLAIRNPIIRMLYDKHSATARRVVDELTTHNVLKKKHLDGIASEHMPLNVEINRAVDVPQASQIRAIRDARRQMAARGVRFPGLTRAAQEENIAIEVGRYMTRGDKGTHPEIVALAQANRKIIDEWTQRAIEVGLLSWDDVLKAGETALSYYPRLYDLPKIDANYAKWRRLFHNHFLAKSDVPPEEIEDAIDAVTMTIRGTPLGRMTMPAELEGAISGRFKARTIDIPDIQLEPFLIRDSRTVMNRYLSSVVPEVLLKERYGADDVVILSTGKRTTVNIKSISQQIADEYGADIARAADAGESVAKLQAGRDTALEDFQAILTRLAGYDAPSSVGSAIGREVRSWIGADSLGNLVLASIQDVAGPIWQTGLANFIKTRPAAWLPETWTASAKADLKAMGIGLDNVLSSRMLKFTELEDAPAWASLGSIGSRKVAPAVFKAIGANLWNSSLKRGTGVAVQNRILTDVLRYSKLSKTRRAVLASWGIDEEWASRLAKQFKAHGQTRTGAKFANSTQWDDIAAAERFEHATLRVVDSTIITPAPGEVPRVLDNAVGRMLTQFKTFLLASQTQLMIPIAQRMAMGDVRALNGFITFVTLGAMQEYIRMVIRNDFDNARIKREIDRLTVADWIRAGVDRSGVLGFTLEGYNVLDHVAGGRLSTSLGMSEGSRYWFRGEMGSISPAAGALENVMDLIYAPGSGFTQKDLHTMRRMIPMQNATYAAWLFDKAEQHIAKELNIPKGKQRKRRFRKQQVKF